MGKGRNKKADEDKNRNRANSKGSHIHEGFRQAVRLGQSDYEHQIANESPPTLRESPHTTEGKFKLPCS